MVSGSADAPKELLLTRKNERAKTMVANGGVARREKGGYFALRPARPSLKDYLYRRITHSQRRVTRSSLAPCTMRASPSLFF